MPQFQLGSGAVPYPTASLVAYRITAQPLDDLDRRFAVFDPHGNAVVGMQRQ